ncbi:hypothetical protein ABB02_00189 [Clostridiaceae bacterium JG1575]|nr:hypothetical protein ABB02_00189 [Clostridiaceae bacterium JG1575]
MDRDVIAFLSQMMESGRPCALITLEEQEGSAPGLPGALMALASDGSFAGTCGGGALEKEVVRRTLEGFERGEHFRFAYRLGEDLGMNCGGSCQGFVRYFLQGPSLIVFGAGHCSQALVRLMDGLPFSITVVDEREGYEELPVFRSCQFLRADPKEAKKALRFTKDTYIVVATWGHLLDAQAYRECLREPYAYLGGLGSRKKSAAIKATLLKEGFPKEKIEALHLPIGLDLADGSPEEIAVSILAEILLTKNHKKLRFKREASEPVRP